MKKQASFWAYLTLLATLWLLSGCKKEKTYPEPVFTINAGEDIEIVLPVDSARLNGVYNGLGGASFYWRQIEGVSSVIIEGERSLNPKISGLLAGLYKFELAGISNLKYKRDTVQITVVWPHEDDREIGDKEIILENLVWVLPWYNSLEIPNFSLLVENGELFEVYIKRDGMEDWIRVVDNSEYTDEILYVYQVQKLISSQGPYYSGSLFVHYFGSDIEDTPSLKIIY